MNKITEATSPPNIKPNDPGILTLQQYFTMRNPSGKMHPSSAYQSTLESLNYGIEKISTSYRTNNTVSTLATGLSGLIYIKKSEKNDSFMAIVYSKTNGSDGIIVGVIYNSVAQYNPDYLTKNDVSALENQPFVKTIKANKYPERLYEQIRYKLGAIYNKENYGPSIKSMKLKGQYFTVHEDTHGTICAMNQDGLIVASAQNEWGTTLIMVAQEYKGYGLGPKLASMHIDKFNLGSGGYTSDGINNAKKIWNNRVQEFIRNGWYSELIKNGTITREQVKNIINDFKSKPNTSLPDAQTQSQEADTGKLLIWIDEERLGGVLYNSNFLQDQSEQFIYGSFFFGGNPQIENTSYLFSFEFDDDSHRKILSYVVLQIVKDDGHSLDVSREGSAYFPEEGLKNIKTSTVKNHTLLKLMEDKIDVKKFQKQENAIRGKVDEYNEIYYQLIEIAESKYNRS